MKKPATTNRWLIVIVIFSLFLLQSCRKNSFAEFAPRGTEKMELQPIGTKVESYTLVCNPKANSWISLKLEGIVEPLDAKDLSPEQLTAILAILNTGNATYDQNRKEFRVLDYQPISNKALSTEITLLKPKQQ